jgi:PAS domain S-box-containing protein
LFGALQPKKLRSEYLQGGTSAALACLTLLFGVASLLFDFSHVWAVDWWLWHVFRLLAYLIVLAVGYKIVVEIYEHIALHAVELEVRVNQWTMELRETNQCLQAEITQRKAEEKLAGTAAYTRSLIEASQDPLVTIGTDGKITDVNMVTEHATGISRAELIGTEFPSYFTEPEKARAGYQQVFAQGSVTDYPLSLRHKSGRVLAARYASFPSRRTGKRG